MKGQEGGKGRLLVRRTMIKRQNPVLYMSYLHKVIAIFSGATSIISSLLMLDDICVDDGHFKTASAAENCWQSISHYHQVPKHFLTSEGNIKTNVSDAWHYIFPSFEEHRSPLEFLLPIWQHVINILYWYICDTVLALWSAPVKVFSPILLFITICLCLPSDLLSLCRQSLKMCLSINFSSVPWDQYTSYQPMEQITTHY